MFFSDLDRTIIYSKRFTIEGQDVVPVEQKTGKIISFMTKNAYEALRELRKNVPFIPVTARKWEEIMRVDFIRNNIPPFMICESGRSIFRNGKLDFFWDQHIRQLMKASEKTRSEATSRFTKDMKKIGYPAWEINPFMLMTKVEGWSEENRSNVESMKTWYSERGCNLLIQGRKVYLIPKEINKGNAVRYIMHLLNPNVSVSAGDADMDACMFEHTHYHVVPKHHTIDSNLALFQTITCEEGLLAGEEIIQFATEKLCGV